MAKRLLIRKTTGMGTTLDHIPLPKITEEQYKEFQKIMKKNKKSTDWKTPEVGIAKKVKRKKK